MSNASDARLFAFAASLALIPLSSRSPAEPAKTGRFLLELEKLELYIDGGQRRILVLERRNILLENIFLIVKKDQNTFSDSFRTIFFLNNAKPCFQIK